MTRTALTGTIIGGLAVLAIGAWAVAAPGRQSASPAAPRPPSSSIAPPLSPSPGLSPGLSPPRSAPMTGVGPSFAAAAEPFVQTFANQPGVRPLPKLPSPTAVLHQPPNIDGCDHDYGERTQCVPWTFPPGVTDKCAWLTAHGFSAVRVVGKDRQHLDPDGDGIACD